jgi:hypothetical protein
MRISLGGLVGFLFAAAVSVAATAQTNDTVKARLVNCGQTVSKACIHDWFPTYGTIIIMDAQSPKGPHLCLPDRNAQENLTAVITWLQQHPETWSETPRDGVTKAVKALYSCR